MKPLMFLSILIFLLKFASLRRCVDDPTTSSQTKSLLSLGQFIGPLRRWGLAPSIGLNWVGFLPEDGGRV
jgi:hypothetical protein